MISVLVADEMSPKGVETLRRAAGLTVDVKTGLKPAELKAILGGWHVSWISTIETGLPYTRKIANDVNRDQNPSNDIVPGFRNSERLPTQYNTDLRLSKRIPLGARARLELIGEAFNVFNQTNVTARQSTYYNFTSGMLVPQQNLANPRLNFGTDSAATIGPDQNARVVQLAAKVTF